MSEKKMNARILHKHDTEANWNKATGFIPKEGELIIYDVDSSHSQSRFKVGDGKTVVMNLPFTTIDDIESKDGVITIGSVWTKPIDEYDIPEELPREIRIESTDFKITTGRSGERTIIDYNDTDDETADMTAELIIGKLPEFGRVYTHIQGSTIDVQVPTDQFTNNSILATPVNIYGEYDEDKGDIGVVEVNGELLYNGKEVATIEDIPEAVDLHGVEFTDNSMELPFRTHEGPMGIEIQPYEINAKSNLNINAVHTNGTLDETGWKYRNIISYLDYDPITPGEEYTDILTIGTPVASNADMESQGIRIVDIEGKNIIFTPELEPMEGGWFPNPTPAMEITGTDKPIVNTYGKLYYNGDEVATKADLENIDIPEINIDNVLPKNGEVDGIDIRYKNDTWTSGEAYSIISVGAGELTLGYDGAYGTALSQESRTAISGHRVVIKAINDEDPVVGPIPCTAITVNTVLDGMPIAQTNISGQLLYNDKEVATKEDITNAGGESVDLHGVEFKEGVMTLPAGADGYDILASGNLNIIHSDGSDVLEPHTRNILSYNTDTGVVKLGGEDSQGQDLQGANPVIEGSNIKLQVYPRANEYDTGVAEAIVIEGFEDYDNIRTVAKTNINGELYYNNKEVATKEDIINAGSGAVTSINGKVGAVTLEASDVGALDQFALNGAEFRNGELYLPTGSDSINGEVVSIPYVIDGDFELDIKTRNKLTYNGKEVATVDDISEGYELIEEDTDGKRVTIKGAVTEGINTGVYSDNGDSALVAGSHIEGYSTKVATLPSGMGAEEVIDEWENLSNKQFSLVAGMGSHVEGINNLVVAEGAHAEGKQNLVQGNYSHAEGCNTTASDHYTHAEGYGTKATKGYAHAEGQNTSAIATAAHAEGSQTTASGPRAHAEGYITTASGGNAHAEGARTQATGSNSHAEGEYTEAKGDYTHAEGRYTIAGGRLTHAEGYKTEVYGENSHIEGLSSNRASSMVSNLTLDTDENTIKTAWESNKFALVLTHNAHGEGRDNLVFGECSHAEGRNNIAGNKTSGWYAHAEGKNTTATGNASHSEGINTEATGAVSHAEGSNTTASGDWSHSEGADTQATNVYAHAEGYGTIASAEASHASGYNTRANEPAQFVCGSCNADENSALFIVGASKDANNRTNCFSTGTTAEGESYLKVGSTTLTETQLIKILKFIESVEEVNE